MLTISFRALGGLLSGAALVGWLAGSVLNPPVAVTQTATPHVATVPVARSTLPRLAWPAVMPVVARPAPSRNPFAFRADARPISESARVRAVERERTAAEATAAEVSAGVAEADSRWRLSGIAASENGDVVAVIAGGGDVHLMRAGDALPGGDGVVEVGLDHVVIRTAVGTVTLRLP